MQLVPSCFPIICSDLIYFNRFWSILIQLLPSGFPIICSNLEMKTNLNWDLIDFNRLWSILIHFNPISSERLSDVYSNLEMRTNLNSDGRDWTWEPGLFSRMKTIKPKVVFNAVKPFPHLRTTNLFSTQGSIDWVPKLTFK